MSEYGVIYEQGPTSWGAWVPDLPGCAAAGESRSEVEQLIAEAIEAHIESLREHGEPVPEPSSTAGAVQVPSRLSGRPGASDPLPRASIYGVLYIEDGNFLNWYDRRDDAERDVLEVAEQDRAQATEFGYFAYDDTGELVGGFVSGADLLARHSATA